MQHGDDASHESPGAAHVLLLGVVDVLPYYCSFGRAPRRRRRHGVIINSIYMLDALEARIVRRPARRGAARSGGRGCRRDADRRAAHRRWGSLSACKASAARERCLRRCGALAVEASRSAREASTPRTALRGEPTVDRKRTGFARQKQRGQPQRASGAPIYIGLGSNFGASTAAGSDAARRLSCDGPGTKAKLFLHTEAKALPAQYAS